VGVAAGFITLWFVEANLDLAWPWYCALGGLVSCGVAWVSSVLIDGFQDEWPEYTVPGQKAMFLREGLAEKEDGWYVVPGKVDRASYGLLVYFVVCLAGLWLLHDLI